MAFVRIQGEEERKMGVYYQVDDSSEPIGVGGMGQVFEGIRVEERTGVTRPVAIKFMFDDLPAQAIDRARREASIQLRNDNLVEMLGFIEIDERQPNGEIVKHFHVVSELLNGVSLSDLMAGKTTDRNGNVIPFAAQLLQYYRNDSEHFAKIVVINILSGLMALHDAGYIHRDIDPSNIMVTSDGHIKLIDFGIAKQMRTLTTSDKSLTVAGKFMGKPEYAAPELALGDIQHQNQTTDIYAMGILLYQCIVGHTPFEGARHEILDMQLTAKMPLDVIRNKELRAIIAKACEKIQDKRFQSSAEMRVALENPQSMNAGLPKNMIIMIASAAAVVILLLGGILLSLLNKEPKEPVIQEITNTSSLGQSTSQPIAEQPTAGQNSADLTASINDLMEKADQDAKYGSNSENDNYENSLMSAYRTYEEIENLIGNDSRYTAQLSDATTKKKKVWNNIENALKVITQQAKELEDLDRSDLSISYRERQHAIEEFIKSHKKY